MLHIKLTAKTAQKFGKHFESLSLCNCSFGQTSVFRHLNFLFFSISVSLPFFPFHSSARSGPVAYEFIIKGRFSALVKYRNKFYFIRYLIEAITYIYNLIYIRIRIGIGISHLAIIWPESFPFLLLIRFYNWFCI